MSALREGPNEGSTIAPEEFRAMWLREVPRVVAAHQAELAQIRLSRGLAGDATPET